MKNYNLQLLCTGQFIIRLLNFCKGLRSKYYAAKMLVQILLLDHVQNYLSVHAIHKFAQRIVTGNGIGGLRNVSFQGCAECR